MKFRNSRKKHWIALFVLGIFWIQTSSPRVWAQETNFSSRKNIAIVGFAHGVHLDQETQAYKTIRSTLQEKQGYFVLDAATVEMAVSQNASRNLQASSEKLEKAYEFFVQGVEHYRNLDLTQAIRDLNRAVKGYREGIASLEDNHYLLYSHLYLGMALYFDGRTKEGEKFIYEMVKLDPKRKTRTLPSRDFPPKIVQIHKEQTQRIERIAKGTIKVDSSPSAARVYLDGMDVGETPITLKDVPVGQHFIAIDQSGHEIFKQLLEVKEGTQNVIADLTPKKMFYTQNQFEQANQQDQTSLLTKMAKELSVDYFVLGQVEPKDKGYVMHIQSYDVMNASYSSVFSQDLGTKERKYEDKIAKLTNSWFDTAIKSSPGTTSSAIDFQEDFQEPTFTPEPREKKGFDKKWLWIGLGALAVGAGAVLIFSGSDDANSNVLSVDNPLN